MSIDNTIKILSTGYNDLPHLRALVALVPGIGSTLDFYLSTPGQKFAEERIEYMINELHMQLDGIEKELIDKKLFNSEEGFDIVNKAFNCAARTRQRSKLKIFASIIRGAFIIQSNKHDPELYIRIVDELSERELEIGFLLYNVKKDKLIEKSQENGSQDDSMSMDSEWIAKNYPNYSKEELDYSFSRLERTGLIKELVGTFLGYGGGHYNITSLFKDLIDFIVKEE